MSEPKKRGRPVGYRAPNPRKHYIHIKLNDDELKQYEALGKSKWFREQLKEAQSQWLSLFYFT